MKTIIAIFLLLLAAMARDKNWNLLKILLFFAAVGLFVAAAAKEAMLQKRSIREFHAAQMTLARATVRLKVKSVNQQP